MDLFSWEFIYGVVITAIVSGLLICYLYKKYYDVTHDEAKYVVLLDFESHLQQIGRFVSFSPNPTRKIFRINVEESDGAIEEWAILLDNKYSFGSISVDYGKYLCIWCNFIESNFEKRTIKPLFDVEIIKIGLVYGIKAINGEINPLKERIENLEKTNKIYLKVLQDYQNKTSLDNLNYVVELGEANDQFVSKVKMQFRNHVAISNAKADRALKSNVRGLESEVEKEVKGFKSATDTILKKAKDAVEAEESEA